MRISSIRAVQKAIAVVVHACLEKYALNQQELNINIVVNRTTEWTTMLRIEDGEEIVQLEVTVRRR